MTCAFSNGIAYIPGSRCDELGGLVVEDNSLESSSFSIFSTRRVLIGVRRN